MDKKNLIDEGIQENITWKTFPCLCMDRTLNAEIDEKIKEIDSTTIVLCTAHCELEKQENTNVEYLMGANCNMHGADEALENYIVSKGGYIISSEVLLDWRNFISKYGFDKETVSEVVYFETGTLDNYDKLLQAFSEFVNRPFVVFKGMNRQYGEMLNLLIRKKLLEVENKSLNNQIKELSKRATEYRVTIQLFEEIVVQTSKEAVLMKINETFLMLFGAQEVSFITEESLDYQRLMDQFKDKGVVQFSNDFEVVVMIKYDVKVFGFLRVTDFMLPQYLDQYVELIVKTGQLIAHSFMLFERTDYEVIKRTNVELNQLNVDLKRVTKMKESFFANMSHEIRTPLNGIFGMLQLIEDTDLSSQQAGMVDLCINSTELLLDIINNILDFSKLEANMLTLHLDEFDIRETVRNTIRLFEPVASNNSTKLILTIDSAVPNLIFADELHIRQIINNLVSNAIKFTDHGQVKVVLSLNHDDENKITCEIIDNGIGIPKESLQSIFDEYSQVDGSELRRFKGSGLGLPIAKKLAELMNGTIEVESELGRGSTFRVIFEYTTKPEISKETLEKCDENVSSKGIKVLIAEDDLVSRVLISSVAKKKDWEYEMAENGSVAVALAKENKYDIILMDIQMPILNGDEAAAQIRLDQTNFDTPIIALTANINYGSRERLESIGMNDFLTKPYKVTDLENMILKWIK